MEKPFLKLPNNKLAGPYIDVYVGFEKKERILCRLDTGADPTALPKDICEKHCIHNNNSIRVRYFSGETTYVQTYTGWITVEGRDFYLTEIITTESEVGLLGMDVISRMSLYMAAGVIILE